ncbi:hypothetical protein HFN63_35840 [Rhizobium leguminosarum]|uniref:hypothetical protein n=1 Tax=Rhizobium leguminosarum TaxID=384 RepID=UPI001C97A8BD|nr:hypothetical protein [Rhizobium leguminosarum]MBY5775305.1 hypothetical protein [Rhizobium leguminosarum]
MRFNHRDAEMPDASTIAHDIKATPTGGLPYLPGLEEVPIRRFVCAFPEAAANPRAIVDAFRD